MPIIFNDTQIATQTPANVTLTPQRFTASAGARGVVLTNYSEFIMTVRIVTQATTITVPPYAQYKFTVIANEAWEIDSSLLSSAVAIPNAVRYVEYHESRDALEPGIVMLAQLPAYQLDVKGNVTLEGTATVNIGNTPEVTIGGTPAVTLSGENTVNIGNTPSVTLAGETSVNIGNVPAVTISGTPEVTLSGSGNSVNIANAPDVSIIGTPSVNVANTTIPVANAPGGTLNIAGQVNIGNTPAVTINGTPNVAISSGSVNATIQNAQLNSQITNAMLGTNELIQLGKATMNVSNLASGGRTRTPDISGQVGLYDQGILVISSLIGYGGYSFEPLEMGCYLVLDAGVTRWKGVDSPAVVRPGTGAQNAGTYAVYFDLAYPQLFNDVICTIVNSGAAAVVNDTITITAYGRQAATIVRNSPNSPAMTQAPTGTGVASGQVLINSGTAAGVIPSGGVMYKLLVSIYNNSAAVCPGNMILALNNGSTPFGYITMANIPASGGRDPVTFDFGPGGIPNNGINAYLFNQGGANALVVATAVKG